MKIDVRDLGTAAGPATTAAIALSSLAIDNLRGVVILLVLAFHSVLAYVNFLPDAPFAFDAPPFMWRSFPIVDQHRFIGFDLFCAWLDVFLMSFFLFLSGLFVWPSLSRKRPRGFLSDRLLRLGLPFALCVMFLVPLAHYPTYLQTAAEPGFKAYWQHLIALPFWPNGPTWFLWLLLAGDLLAAGLYPLASRYRDAVLRASRYARRHPGRFVALFLLASAVAYVPLALIFGPSQWFHRGPFSFQLSRPLHYAVYFLGGALVGACGLERGLLSPDGPLASRWRLWLAAAPLSLMLWMGLMSRVIGDPAAAPLYWQVPADISFTVACLSGTFLALAAALRFGRLRIPALTSLRDNAYGMYLVHYLPVVWLQYALLRFDLPAVVKAAIVFAGAVSVSWFATAMLRRTPLLGTLIGPTTRGRAKLGPLVPT